MSLETLLYFLFINLLDILTTNEAINKGAKEINPIANFIYSKLGLRGLFILKYGVLAVLLLIINTEQALWIMNILFTVIVLWNSVILARISGKNK